MEGEGCQTIRTDLDKISTDNLCDSVCEQSPLTPPPPVSSSCLSQESELSRIITYDREFLLSRQFTPLALKPDVEQLLFPDYIRDNNGSYGIFNTNHCYYNKPKAGASTERKELGSECFRTLVDTNLDALRPQRKSFVSGCQMKSAAITDSGDKSGGSKSNGSSQRRNSESSDRPRSVPTVDRKVGSGRLPIERSDSRGSTDKGSTVISREKPTRSQNTADKLNNWRQRKSEEENIAPSEGHGDRRPTRDSREPRLGYQSHGYNGRRYNNDADPEWFSESVAQTDTIELIGFEGHQEKIDKREKREKARKKKEVFSSQSNAEDALLVKPIEADSSEFISSESEKTEDMFDFDAFMMKEKTGKLGPKHQPDAVITASDTPSSRFSRWFSKENGSSVSDELSLSDNTCSYLHGSLEEDLQVTANIDSLVHDILSVGDDELPADSLTVPQPSNSGGSLILQMLQQSSKPTAGKGPAAAPVKPQQTAAFESPTATELPAALTKLLSSSATTKPSLPAEYKMVEELEAGMKPAVQAAARPANAINATFQADLTNPSLPLLNSSPKSKPKQSPPQDMAAFNKLVGLLQDTGELNKSVPKMPEVMVKEEQPNPLKKLPALNHPPTLVPTSTLPSAPASAAPEDIPPIYPQAAAYPRQSLAAPITATPQTGMSAPLLLPHHHQLTSNTSMAAVTGGLLPTALAVSGGPVSVPAAMAPLPPAQHLGMAAFQVPVNPILQQTIHHSQKVPSPIMFGNQPPVHIVAPAPIHPIGGPLINQSQAFYGQQTVSSNQQSFEQSCSSGSFSAQTAAAVATMAFTPTSVMRKRANDKVEERHKQGDSNGQSRVYSPAIQELYSPQSQHATMRPIVKNNGPTSVADQMRRLMDGPVGHPAMQPPHHYTQHQSAPVPQQCYQPTNSLLATMGNGMNGLHHPRPQQQQVNLSMYHHQQPTISPSVQQQLHLGADLHQQLARLQQRQQQQQALGCGSADNSSTDNLSKWFCAPEITSQQRLPLPKHANMLTLDDIEH